MTQNVTDPENAIRAVFIDLAGVSTKSDVNDYQTRPIIVTPYGGNYGFAGCVVVLEGSPPRGTFVVPKEAIDYDVAAVVHVTRYRVKRFTKGQRHVYGAVVEYLQAMGWTSNGRRAALRDELADTKHSPAVPMIDSQVGR